MRRLLLFFLLFLSCVSYADYPKGVVYVNYISTNYYNHLFHITVSYYEEHPQTEEGSIEIQESGATIEDIRAEHPDLFENYIRPHGDDLSIPLIESWQIFTDEFVVTDVNKKIIKDAIVDFGSDDHKIRMKAQKRLENADCFLTLLKLDGSELRKGLTLEQNVRLDCCVNYGIRINNLNTIKTLKNDIRFLEDCRKYADANLKIILNNRIDKLIGMQPTTKPTTKHTTQP